jgi:hypothetical protein
MSEQITIKVKTLEQKQLELKVNKDVRNISRSMLTRIDFYR